MNLLNVDKQGGQAIVHIKMKSVQMNLLNIEKQGWQSFLHIKMKSVQLNSEAHEV